MSKVKILKKERVLSCGSGDYRAILDQDSGIAYAYTEPSKVLAVFEPKINSWVTYKRPSYSTGGWGSGSSGDANGYHRVSNTMEMLEALSLRYYKQTSETLMGNDEVIKYNKEIKEYNSKIDGLNSQIKKVEGEKSYNTLTKKKEIELDYINGSKRGRGDDVFNLIERFETITKKWLDRKFKRIITLDAYTFEPNEIKQNGIIIAFFNKSGDLVMNSQLLNVSSFERNFLGSESIIQKLVRESAKINIPFNVLSAAGLKLEQTKTIDQGAPETVRVAGQDRHFTGALLLENNTRKFLMDIDRVEIQHGIFNAFFVEVKKEVKTISEAYESMKPLEVIEAEQRGEKILRQGEWFFIPTDYSVELTKNRILQWLSERDTTPSGDYLLNSSISHGKGRPNTLHVLKSKDEKLNGLVSGIVKHTGREHKDLVLCNDFKTFLEKQNDYRYNKAEIPLTVNCKLWRVIGNTTVSNFQITGDID